MTHGAIDLGRLPVGSAGTALAWGLVAASVLAIAAVSHAGAMAVGGPARLGIGALAALVAWSALSLTWASAPDRAWLATNRAALGLGAMVIGASVAMRLPDPARRLAVGVAGAAVPILVWALGTRVLPELLAPIDDGPRLAAPIGHANTLALIAAFVVPGALCLAGSRWRGAGAVILMLGLVVVAMSGSRSGILALVTACALALWLQRDRALMLATLGAGVVGAAPAAIFALTVDAFATGGNTLGDPADRRGAGLVLGALLVVGAALAAGLVPSFAPTAGRVARWLEHPRAGRIVLAGTGLVIAGGVVLAALIGRDAEPGATRVLSLSGNNRTAWWGEAWRGFLDAPLAGHGAGSFPLTHLAERTLADDRLQVRQPHQLGLELLSELGLIGLLLGVIVVAAVAWAASRARRAAGPAIALVAPFLVQAQLDIPWTSPAATIPTLAAAGVVVAMGVRAGAREPRAAWTWVGLVTIVGVGAIVSALWLWSGERRGTAAYLTSDPLRAAALGHAAASRAPLAIAPLLVEARALDALNDRAGATTAARRAVDRQPDNPFAWQCLAAVARSPLQTTATERWTRLDPNRPTAVAARCLPGW